MAIMTREISKYDDVIDSREVIERIAELEAYGEGADYPHDPNLLSEGELAELTALRALAAQGEGVEDWQYGATLIRGSYFVGYAQELAEDIGAIDSNTQWPARHIDWEAAAYELQTDYTDVEFDGVTYWVR